MAGASDVTGSGGGGHRPPGDVAGGAARRAVRVGRDGPGERETSRRPGTERVGVSGAAATGLRTTPARNALSDGQRGDVSRAVGVFREDLYQKTGRSDENGQHITSRV